MSTIDQQFVEYIIKSLVSKPDEVKIERRVDEKGVLLELTVDAEDLGRVIGKRGATAQSLRTLLRALGTKNEARYNLKIIDTSEGGEPIGRPTRQPEPTSSPSNDENEPMADDSGQESSDDNAAPVSDDVAPADDEIMKVHQDEEPAVADEPAEEPESDVISKTRKELEDLDDLDV